MYHLPQHITGVGSDDALMVIQALSLGQHSGMFTIAGKEIRIANGHAVGGPWEESFKLLLRSHMVICWSWRRTRHDPRAHHEPVNIIYAMLRMVSV